MINNKTFEHKPIEELMSIVKNDFRKFDSEGLIDEGNLIKTVMYCNDKIVLGIREIREAVIPVDNNRAELPKDFEKLYYVCALQATNTLVHNFRNPFDNSFDADVIYDAHLDRESLGCVENYQVIVKRDTQTTIHNHGTWVELDVDNGSKKFCHIDCPNKRKKGRYTVEIKEDYIETPFRSGELYLMYVGMMKDEDGNITFPFHPMITPYYEWAIKEKILSDAIFNSDSPGIGDMFKLAQQERLKAWIEAYNFTMDRSYGEYLEAKRKRELGWYNQYFKYLQ
jgi:hypothetical protein